MKNKTTIAVVISVSVILVAGIASFALMNFWKGDSIDPLAFIPEDCGFYAVFDFGMNMEDVKKTIEPFRNTYGDETVEYLDEFMQTDLSFLNLSGFVVKNSESILSQDFVVGLEITDSSSARKGIDDIYNILKFEDKPEIEEDEKGFIKIGDDFVCYISNKFLLISESSRAIRKILDVKSGEDKSIRENADWKKISPEMSSKFSIFAQVPMGKEPLVIAGTELSEKKSEYGFELILIEGRQRLKSSIPDKEAREKIALFDELFENSRDLSDVLSMLPSAPMIGAASMIPNFNLDLSDSNENIFYEGDYGFWGDLDEFNPTGIFSQLMKPSNISVNKLLEHIFPEDDYQIKDVSGIKEIYSSYYFPITPFDDEETDEVSFKSEPSFFASEKNGAAIISTNIDGLDFDPVNKDTKTGDVVLYFLFDFKDLIEKNLDSFKDAEYESEYSLEKYTEKLKEIDLQLTIKLFEKDSDMRLKLALSGDLKEFESLLMDAIGEMTKESNKR
ncbi:MAG: hypothetical protein R2883_07635 [Caldisericia bacterium]